VILAIFRPSGIKPNLNEELNIHDKGVATKEIEDLAMEGFMQGRPPPWGNDAFPPCFKFFRRKGKFSQFTFSQKSFQFSSAKISDDPFPLFRENYYFPPTLSNFPPDFVKFTCFLHILYVFSFPPYFGHDAFMHHPMHVLDAPGFMPSIPKEVDFSE